MELRHIRYFVRAAELLHFTQAAESLFVTQPTLSGHMQQLEQEVGQPLFDRVGRNVRLTEAGRIFLEHAQTILRELEVGIARMDDLRGLSTGSIRLGALMTFGPELLPAWISSFHKSYPKIHIVLTTGTSDYLDEGLRAGAIDLALSIIPSPSDNIESEVLFSQQIHVALAKTHPLASRKEIDMETLESIPLALVTRRWYARRIYDAFFATHGIKPEIVIEVDDLQALVGIISEGNVGGLLSRMVASRNPNVCLVPIAKSPLAVSYGVMRRVETHRSPAIEVFLDHIKRHCHISEK